MYLLVFIQNLLMHRAEKILLLQPLTFGEDYLGLGLPRFMANFGFGCDVIGGAWTRSMTEAQVCVFYAG